jgi:hypothetical protein
MPIIFFDDNSKNIEDMRKNIGCKAVEINKEAVNEFISNPPSKAEYPNLEMFDRNTYVEYNDLRNTRSKNHRANTGVTKGDITRLEKWVKQNRKHPTIAIFDWDRTISVVEGVHFPQPPNTWSDFSIREKDVMLYLLGGKDRRKRMKEMFNFLYKENVEVFILTKNGACPTDYFLDMVRLVAGQRFQEDHLICSSEYATKSEALKKNNEFNRVTKGDRLICQARKANGQRCTSHSISFHSIGGLGLCRVHKKSLGVICPPGKERSPDHATKCLIKCKSGRLRNTDTLRCRNVRKSIKSKKSK